MQEYEEKLAWRRVKYKQRFLNAFRGIYIVFKTTKHIFIHFFATLIVFLAGLYFNLSNFEWIVIIFCIGLVFISEAFNTAIEIDIDLTSPLYHPYARDTKDVAAAAVMLSVFTAIIVGLIVFIPKVIHFVY